MEDGINNLRRRILEISYKYRLSHIGSCITAVGIIDEIYKIKKENESFCLGNSHAALALYVILEKFYGFNAEKLYEKHGTHANRSVSEKIFVSGGSLGTVEPIALGIAISNPLINVYLLSSDGGMMEGSCWETLRFKSDNKINNLKWYINCNGYGAYCEIDYETLKKRIKCFCRDVKVTKTDYRNFGFLNGIDAHYIKITNEKFYNK